MDPGAADAPGGSGDPPSPSPSSAATATATAKEQEEEEPIKKSNQDVSEQPAAATTSSSSQQQQQQQQQPPPSRYESQKRRDWNTFLQHLKNQKPPLALPRCGGAHVIEFLKYLDQFGKTKVHAPDCAYFGHPTPPNPCACPLRQAWGSLDALIGRLRAAYEENGGKPESNPFGAKAVRVYLREVRESQAKARGIPYEKKKRKRQSTAAAADVASASTPTEEGSSSAAAAVITTTAAADSSTASEAADSNTKKAEGGDTKTTTS